MLPFLSLLLVAVPARYLAVLIVLGSISVLQMFLVVTTPYVPDPNLQDMTRFGFFHYSTIYSHCLRHLSKGYFAVNIGKRVLGVPDPASLLPLAFGIFLTGYLFFSPGCKGDRSAR